MCEPFVEADIWPARTLFCQAGIRVTLQCIAVVITSDLILYLAITVFEWHSVDVCCIQITARVKFTQGLQAHTVSTVTTYYYCEHGAVGGKDH